MDGTFSCLAAYYDDHNVMCVKSLQSNHSSLINGSLKPIIGAFHQRLHVVMEPTAAAHEEVTHIKHWTLTHTRTLI